MIARPVVVITLLSGVFLGGCTKSLKPPDLGGLYNKAARHLDIARNPVIVIPGIQKMVKVSLRTVVMDVPPQDIITKDNVTVKVNAVVYFRVLDHFLQVAVDFLALGQQIVELALTQNTAQGGLADL